MVLLLDYLVAAAVIFLFLGGIAFFRDPRTARLGGWLNILAYGGAVIFVLFRYPTQFPAFLLLSVLVGGAVGAFLAIRVSMLAVPQMVAFQHGCGGAAAFLIAFAEYVVGGSELTLAARIGGISGMVVGAVTFSGSLVAAGKLANVIQQRPLTVAGHTPILAGLSAATFILALLALAQCGQPLGILLSLLLIIFSIILGVFYTIRIGGADMPVIISFFNATAGFAASFVGIALNNYLLIGCGACVAASGSLLTLTMCQAMNRSVLNVLFGGKHAVSKPVAAMPTPTPNSPPPVQSSPFDRVVAALQGAKQVIIVPGYGMALSQAQESAHQLELWLEARGTQVRYAIHPVAGRMPGHMNVLLAEVGVEYDKLFELDAINDAFRQTDLAIVIGACDVVNSAAATQTDTPIAGMPILNVHEAKAVAVFNWDEKPGFSAVPNPLYQMPQAILLWGDARENLNRTMNQLSAQAPAAELLPPAAAQAQAAPIDQAVSALISAKNAIIAPGYGMALSQAQELTHQLELWLEARGAQVRYAIHPVAGRMPGHMNVLLAEAGVEYEKLFELEAINEDFKQADIALVIGACDVVNPAATTQSDTPIAGMPILNVHQANTVAVFNWDEKPGFSGVPNSLYQMPQAILLWGDARENLSLLLKRLAAE